MVVGRGKEEEFNFYKGDLSVGKKLDGINQAKQNGS